MKRMCLLCWITASILCPQMIRKALSGWSSRWWKAAMILTSCSHIESQLADKLITAMKKSMNSTNSTKSNHTDYFSKAFQGLWIKINLVNFSRKKKESMILQNIQFSSSSMAILKLFAWRLLCCLIVVFQNCMTCFLNQ